VLLFFGRLHAIKMSTTRTLNTIQSLMMINSLFWFLFVGIFSQRHAINFSHIRVQRIILIGHIFAVVVWCVLDVARPFWQDGVNDHIWNPFMCNIFIRSRAIVICFSILPVRFIYNKTLFYKEFLNFKDSEYRWLGYLIMIGFVLIFQGVVILKVEPFTTPSGSQECFHWTSAVYIIIYVIALWLTVLYVWMNSIFNRNYEGLGEFISEIPPLKSYIQLNQWLCTILFGSKFCLFFFLSYVIIYSDEFDAITKESMTSIILMADWLFSSVVMFYAIYGVPLQNQQITAECVWVCFDSLPPIEMKRSLVESRSSWNSKIVIDQEKQRSLRRYFYTGRQSVRFEIQEPVLDQSDLNASGRISISHDQESENPEEPAFRAHVEVIPTERILQTALVEPVRIYSNQLSRSRSRPIRSPSLDAETSSSMEAETHSNPSTPYRLYTNNSHTCDQNSGSFVWTQHNLHILQNLEYSSVGPFSANIEV